MAEEDAKKTVVPGAAAAQATARAAAWIENVRFEDAMDPYAAWVGDWSDYWGDYQWRPLPGGATTGRWRTRRAVVEVLRRIALRQWTAA
ncbi:hypothetical protein ACIQ8G_26480 [Streptomyces sp. NPDC094154]|uniref:hypothetical protein n=1 Tax=Streptomyces sp. NPDC094154 TaxID=3366059 RepID=UPI0037F25B9A